MKNPIGLLVTFILSPVRSFMKLRKPYINTMIYAVLTILATVHQSHATTITFEDLTTRNNFTALGIVDTYQGYEWGYGNSGGFANADWGNTDTGWASATVSNPAIFPAPLGLGGQSYAWNWNGPQSLWIDFQVETDVYSVDLAILSIAYSSNATNLTLFGYDSGGSLLSSTSPLFLSGTFQTTVPNFQDIRYLEFRANASGRWFSVDNIVLQQVAEPASFMLLVAGLALMALIRQRTC